MNLNEAPWLEILLDLKRKPVGIHFLLSEEEYNECSTEEVKSGIVYCTAVRNAGDGKECKMKQEHFACLSAAAALGIMKMQDKAVSGQRYKQMGVYENLGVSRSIVKDMVYCAHSCYGVEIKPLDNYVKYEPDIVIVVTNPYNAMRIIQGNAYHNGQLKDIKVAGMQAICQECTSYPHEKSQINISLLCSGTRCVAQWGKDELGIGIPFHIMPAMIDGLRKTINHMDKNDDKKLIAQKLKANNLEEELEIVYNKNYYTNVYGTLEQLKNRSNNLIH